MSSTSRPAWGRLGLLDAMILVAGVAVGLSAIAAARPFVFDRPLPAGSLPRLREIVLRAQIVGASLLAGGTLAVVVGAGVSGWRGGGAPGVVASVAASAGVVGHLLTVAVGRAARRDGTPWFDGSTDAILVLFPASYIGGLLVAGAWLGLALGRAWRPEPTWTDRLGRSLGAAWLALLALAQVRSVL